MAAPPAVADGIAAPVACAMPAPAPLPAGPALAAPSVGPGTAPAPSAGSAERTQAMGRPGGRPPPHPRTAPRMQTAHDRRRQQAAGAPLCQLRAAAPAGGPVAAPPTDTAPPSRCSPTPCRPTAHAGQLSAELGPNLPIPVDVFANFSRIRRRSGQPRANFGRARLNFADSGQHLAGSAGPRSTDGRFARFSIPLMPVHRRERASSLTLLHDPPHIGPTSVEIAPDARCGRLRTSVPGSSRCSPNSARPGQRGTSTDIDPMSRALGRRQRPHRRTVAEIVVHTARCLRCRCDHRGEYASLVSHHFGARPMQLLRVTAIRLVFHHRAGDSPQNLAN